MNDEVAISMIDKKVLDLYVFKYYYPHELTGELQGFLRHEYHERLVRCLFSVESVLKDIISTSFSLYHGEVVKDGRLAKFSQTDLGKRFSGLLRKAFLTISQYSKYYCFNPYVSLFVDVVSDYASHLLMIEGYCGEAYVPIKVVDVLQSCVEKLRGLGGGAEFKKSLNNYRRLSGKNYSELCGYIDGLLLNWPRLMVMRFELGYRWLGSTENPEEPISNDEQTFGFKRLAEDRAELIKQVRKKIDIHLIGFIWKLNYGPDLSYRYHLILLFDDYNMSKGLHYWSEVIGELWVKEVTHGDGVYFDFDKVEPDPWGCGVEIIKRDDEEKRERLMSMLIYLTKPDDYLRIVTPRNARSLGKGQLPRARKARGRQES